jgi:hypothetical protein
MAAPDHTWRAPACTIYGFNAMSLAKVDTDLPTSKVLRKHLVPARLIEVCFHLTLNTRASRRVCGECAHST